ncbi:MAG: hypothetical protein U0518_01525 [Candidatus Gracilibacteria bacterium]
MLLFYNEKNLDVKYLANLAIYSKVTGAKVSSDVVVDGRNIYIRVEGHYCLHKLISKLPT